MACLSFGAERIDVTKPSSPLSSCHRKGSIENFDLNFGALLLELPIYYNTMQKHPVLNHNAMHHVPHDQGLPCPVDCQLNACKTHQTPPQVRTRLEPNPMRQSIDRHLCVPQTKKK